jgi:hypothetical protein
MHHCLRLIASFFAAAGLSACESVLEGGPRPPLSKSEAGTELSYLIDLHELKRYNSAIGESKKTSRNEIIDERMMAIDAQFHEYEASLWKQRVSGNIAVDWTLLALAGATATIGGESAKAAMGAASAGIIGARESFDKQAFLELALPAIAAQMVAERARIRAVINESKKLPVADYTLYGAMSDLLAYMRAGTIRGSIQTITADAGSKEGEATEKINELRSGSFARDSASLRIGEFLALNPVENDKSLRAWMRNNGLDAGPGAVTVFLNTKEMADLRIKASRELYPETEESGELNQ